MVAGVATDDGTEAHHCPAGAASGVLANCDEWHRLGVLRLWQLR